jgi:ring-1,2-phenylacetyl-CoA epoxidase subunit PaaE
MSTTFYPLTILDITRETDDSIALALAPQPEAASEFQFRPGQHLIFRADINGEDVRRNYSLCVSPTEGSLKVAIKQIDDGLFSNWAVNTLAKGDTIEAMTPRGHFTWDFDPAVSNHYLAFAAGSGITPILSLLKSALMLEPLSRFTLLYGNRDSNSIMFLEELAALKDRYLSRLQIFHFLTAEFDDVDLFNGRLDEERIEDVLESIVDPKAIDVVFICGPGPMMDAAENAMLHVGIPASRVMVERFTSGERSEADRETEKIAREKARGFKMEVRIDGRRRIIAFDAERGNILESARASGLPAPYACKAGVCATCRAKLVSGEVQTGKNYGLSAEEVAQGYILTCQAVPSSEGLVLDYDG